MIIYLPFHFQILSEHSGHVKGIFLLFSDHFIQQSRQNLCFLQDISISSLVS
jgi:hypothetical protein